MRKVIAIFTIGFAAANASAAGLTPVPSALSSQTGAGPSFAPQISADGSHVVFLSETRNLTTNASLTTHFVQVFVRNLTTSNTVMLTTNRFGGATDGDAMSASISSNGQFIAFASRASDLVANDTNDSTDVFMWDAATGQIKLVSGFGSPPVAPANPRPLLNQPLAAQPLISANGRFVFFESRADGLVVTDTNLLTDVFRHDAWSNVTELVSIGLSNQSANAPSELGSVSADGNLVAFVSTADNLAPDSSSAHAKVFVRDMAAGDTVCASSNIGARITMFGDTYRCFNPALAEATNVVVFPVLVNDFQIRIVRVDLGTNGTTEMTRYARTNTFPVLTPDARYVAFDEFDYVLRHDALTGNSETVNVTPPVWNPVAFAISRDGQRVLFGDGRGLYLRDMNEFYPETILANTLGNDERADLTVPSADSTLQHIAFESEARTLVPDDRNETTDVFVREPGCCTKLVSAANPALISATPAFATTLWPNAISADGSTVVFTSEELRVDTNTSQRILLRRLTETNVVTVPDTTNILSSPVLSRDGRFVAYLSRDSSVRETGGVAVLRFDTRTGMNEFISVQTNGQPSWNTTPDSSPPSISSNGQFIVFESNDRALVSGNTSAWTQIFIRNTGTGTNDIASRSSSGEPGHGHSMRPALTADARWLIFLSTATNFGANTGGQTNLFARDLLSGQTVLVSGINNNAIGVIGEFAISPNGRYVLFGRSAGWWYGQVSELLLHDLATHVTTVLQPNDDAHFFQIGDVSDEGVSVFGRIGFDVFGGGEEIIGQRRDGTIENLGVQWNGRGPRPVWKKMPRISADSRFVLYQQLKPQPMPPLYSFIAASQVLVRDRLLGVTLVISSNVNGTFGSQRSLAAQFSPDGRTIAFESFAGDLIAADYNQRRDVFLLKLGAVDSDGDGMDDDWEVANFGNLSRGADGDFDGDGATDGAEFLAGTSPTASDSIFRIFSLTSLGSNSRRLVWTGNPTRSYRVEFKTNLTNEGWNVLNAPISWNGATASVTDNGASAASRYYRAVRLP